MTPLHIALVGPCSPVDLVDCFTSEDQTRAAACPGYRGVPVSALTRALLERGHRVTVITASYDGAEGEQAFNGDGLSMHVIGGRPRPRNRARDLWRLERTSITRLLRGVMPDVVHAHWTYEFALAALASGLPTLVTAHDAPFTILRYHRDPYRTARLAAAMWVRAKRPHLTAVSPYLADRWRREMGWRAPIPVIPNIAPFGPRQVPHAPPLAPRVVTIADAGKLKNVRTLLTAWPLVLEMAPDAELHLVGHGLGTAGDLARWAAGRRCCAQVVWHGHLERADLALVLAASTIMVHPSLEEAQPMVPLEGMALQLPVVGGASSGGVPWTVGNAGVMTDVRSPIALASTIADLIRDPVRCRTLGEAGATRVERVFNPDVVASAYETRYDAVLSDPRSGN